MNLLIEKKGFMQRSAISFVRFVLFFTAVVMVTAVTAMLLRHEPEGVFLRITEIAAWLNGGAKPDVVTWPAWGYAYLVAKLPSFSALILLQACVGTVALTALAGKLWYQMPAHRTLLTGLFLFAIPWINLQAELYPSSLSGALALIALLCLDSALTKNTLIFAVLAGMFAGMAQNFRTEFVLMPVFMGVCILIARRLGVMNYPSFRPVLVFIVTALVLQLPWATFYHAQTGRYSLTESNLGHVLYVSLGSDPGNPWGIKGDDQSAEEAVRRAGHSYSSLSEQGNKLLLSIVVQKVREHPYGLVQRTIHQLKNTILAPFNWGEPKLREQGRLHLDVLREELKSRLGVGSNVRELQNYHERGLYPGARNDLAAVFALIYQCGTVVLGSFIVLLGITGMLLIILRPALRPEGPLLCLLGCTALYKILQNVFLYYQINYLNNVFPMLLPFVSISLIVIFRKLHMKKYYPENHLDV